MGMLHSVPPAGLTNLEITLNPDMPAGLGSWLCDASSLTALTLKGHGLEQQEAGAIGGLTRLRWLGISTGPAPGQLLDSLLRLRQLTSLTLYAQALPLLEALSQLQQLRYLEAVLQPPTGQVPGLPLVVPPPSAFPCLTSHALGASSSMRKAKCRWAGSARSSGYVYLGSAGQFWALMPAQNSKHAACPALSGDVYCCPCRWLARYASAAPTAQMGARFTTLTP